MVNNRKISQKGLDLIKRFEGLRLTAYKCPSKIWTIGYGHTAGVKSGQKITKEQAEEFLKKDVEWAEKAVNKLKYDFTQNEFDALVSFTFNCGTGSLAQLTRNQTRNRPQIANAMVLYCKDNNGNVLEGLKKRRLAEWDLFTT